MGTAIGAVGIFMPVTTLLIYVLYTPQGAPPFARLNPQFVASCLFARTGAATILVRLRATEILRRSRPCSYQSTLLPAGSPLCSAPSLCW
jgi:hypothetical protein